MKYTFMNIILFRCNLINIINIINMINLINTINIETNLEMEDIIDAE
jgi:hypothetical protein